MICVSGIVMPGLDPGIHLLRKLFEEMDCRVKPGNDAFVFSVVAIRA
jgi:hypothetical protein